MEKALEKKYQEQLEALAAEIRADLKSNQDDAATVALDTSIGRLARMDAMQSQQMALELKRRQSQRLVRVETALKAIAEGTFGDCKKCGQPISRERLDYQPDAIFCVACAPR